MKIMDSGGPRIFHRFRQITKVVTDRSTELAKIVIRDEKIDFRLSPILSPMSPNLSLSY